MKKNVKKLHYLICFLSVFLLFIVPVFAIPTGEIYSQTTANNITLLAKFQYASGEVRLYGRSGNGQSNPFVPSLAEFIDGNYSLFTYQQMQAGTRTSFGMHFYLNKTLSSGKSYTATFKVGGTPSTVNYYYSNPTSINNANLNSKSITCLSNSCYISTTFTMSGSTNELHIDFVPPEGLNGEIFASIFTGIFMVQVEEYNYLDTSGIQNNQQIIIDQNQQIIQGNNQTNDKLDDLNDNITNSDSSEATGEASDFFSNFNTDTFGLTSVITAPLNLIKSITSKTCTPLQLTLPFVNEELNLPCLSSIYESHFGAFLTIYRTITFGFVSYWVCIKIFNLVKDFKNPEHDEIEVLDL